MTASSLPATISERTSTLILEGMMRGFGDALGDKYDESRQSPNHWDDPEKRHVRVVVWHITDGGFTSSLGWLCNPESEASANDIINRDGKVWNIVPGRMAPWTNGPLCQPDRTLTIVRQAVERGVNPNWWSYTIENVGTSTYGRAGALSAPQIAALVLRTAQACTEYNLSADPEHILRHAHFDTCTRSGCPGFSPLEMRTWIEAVAFVCTHWRGW